MINAEAVKNAIDRYAECAEHLDPEGAFVLGASVILEMHLMASYEIMEHGPSRDAVRSEIDRVSSIIMNLVAESLMGTGCV